MARITFYSNRTSAHATITVAGIFATYTMLSIMGKLPNWVFGPSYLALVIFDVYSFLNFGYYASKAQKALIDLETIIKVEDPQPKGLLNRKLEAFKKHTSLKNVFLFVIWFLGVGIPTIWVLLKLSNATQFIILTFMLQLTGLLRTTW